MTHVSCDPAAVLYDATLDYAAAEQTRTGREPAVDVAFSNRPRFRFRVTVGGLLVAEARGGDVERAARECTADFERWVKDQAAVALRSAP